MRFGHGRVSFAFGCAGKRPQQHLTGQWLLRRAARGWPPQTWLGIACERRWICLRPAAPGCGTSATGWTLADMGAADRGLGSWALV